MLPVAVAARWDGAILRRDYSTRPEEAKGAAFFEIFPWPPIDKDGRPLVHSIVHCRIPAPPCGDPPVIGLSERRPGKPQKGPFPRLSRLAFTFITGAYSALRRACTRASFMASDGHRKERGVATASIAELAPLSFERQVSSVGASQILPAEAESRLRCGVIKLEDKGDVGVQSATLLEGVEPRIKVVAAAEAPCDDIAVPLLAPSGVVRAANARGTEVEERTDRHHHARAAFSVVLGC